MSNVTMFPRYDSSSYSGVNWTVLINPSLDEKRRMFKGAGIDIVFTYPNTLRNTLVRHNIASVVLDTSPGINTIPCPKSLCSGNFHKTSECRSIKGNTKTLYTTCSRDFTVVNEESGLIFQLTVNQFTIQNNFTFVQKLIEIPRANDYVLASFDVTNLFTNVPVDETIDITMNSLFDKTDIIFGFIKMYFKKLLDIATKDMFWFNGKLYKQIHPNIKFTCEIEHNGHLPFLDIDIPRDGNSFVSSVYRKPSYTGLTTKFNSYIPIKYKGAFIMGESTPKTSAVVNKVDQELLHF
ncbi:uncharacterized protein [Penaeus vannamei]|uniref:uncharacterized protein n=1 Tax=Penaeus vannamei TaxID=6689 RepID=UPI00387F9AE5